MIADHDRAGWIGASDTAFVVGNWKTKTFEKWWLQKLGVNTDHFENRFTLAGTNWEHRILESLGVPGMVLDRQFLIPELRLRVNLDGDDGYRDFECKTYQHCKGWRTPTKYIQQVQVQLFGSGLKAAEIVAYGLTEPDYDNYLRDIDPGRLREIPVSYDPRWIEKTYLPKLRILAKCLTEGRFPYV